MIYRALLMAQSENIPKPLLHYDFSRYTNEQFQNNPGMSIEDLTGNGYNLSSIRIDYKLMSGFGGYTDDWTRYNSGDPDRTDHTAELSNDNAFYAWFWGSNNFQPGETVPAQIVKVSGMDPNASYWLEYNNYSSGILMFYSDGIYLLPEGTHTGSSPTSGIGLFIHNPNGEHIAHVTAEQLPLYPGCFVNDGGNSTDGTPGWLTTNSSYNLQNQFNIAKGFTLLFQRYLENIGTQFFSVYSGGNQINRVFQEYIENNENTEVTAYSFGMSNNYLAYNPRGIISYTSKSYDGQALVKGNTAIDTLNLILGGTSNQSLKGGIRELYLFNQDLTQSQIEEFISENMVPDPLVYYDVRKQNAKNSDETNRGTLIDLSGNGNHGVLNNFQYSASLGDSGEYCIDDVYPLESNTDVTIEGHKVIIDTDFSGETNGRFITGSDRDLTDNILQVPAMRLKVSGLVSGEIQIGYINGSFNNKLTIISDGTYYIPGYKVPKAGENVNRRAWSIYSYYDSNSVGVNSGVVIELLPVQKDGWVETYIDDEIPLTLNSQYKGDSTYGSHILSLKNNGAGWILIADFLDYDTRVKGFTVRVSGMSENQRVEFRKGDNTVLYTILSDGIYEIPPHDAKVGKRPIIIHCSANSTGTVEFLPRTDYLQFDGNKDNITIPTVTEGFKTVLMISETQQNDNERGVVRLYEQRKGTDKTFSLISYDVGHIAYNSLSTGETFINGTLNTTIDGGPLKDHRICVAHRNNDVNADNSKSPIIGAVSQDGNNGPFRIFKFLGFSEYLSDTQIKKVIDRYGLMEGVGSVEDPLKDIHYVADWDAKGRYNNDGGGDPMDRQS